MRQEVRSKKVRNQRPFWLSFAASSGIFFRRRNRSQLFQVLRRLSRGVRYFWLSSLLFSIWAKILSRKNHFCLDLYKRFRQWQHVVCSSRQLFVTREIVRY